MDTLPIPITQVLLSDAAQRDLVTARRKALCEILWCERYLTREGLIARVEAVLGKGCFGRFAWQDTFYRDMRVVRAAFRQAGYELAYSRRRARPGYYLRGQPPLAPGVRRVIAGAVAEVDRQQAAVTRRLRPEERAQQGLSLTHLAHQVVAYRRARRGENHA